MMNTNQIRYAFELMKDSAQLIEVRVLGNNKTYSGYFKNVDKLIEQVQRFDNLNVYFVLNSISEACYSREQMDSIIEKPKNTTSDNDIIRRDWLLIDIDTKRATGVSSSIEEKEKSKVVANKVYQFLKDFGFAAPICADSGNGYHLLYKIDLEATEAIKTMLQVVLQVLDMYFSNDTAEIDKTVFNASRITKMYGTFARKGKDSEDRPHRESRIISAPEQLKTTPLELLERLAELLPKQEKPTYSNNYTPSEFSLDAFISSNGINVKNTVAYQGGTKYELEHCLFDHSHKGKDACLFKLGNGAIGYKCLHNSCSQYKWQDVRLLFDATAYNQKNEFRQHRDVVKPISIATPQAENQDIGNKFLQFHEVKNIDRSKIIAIQSGLHALDRKIIGFNKGEVSVWSGKNGSAKSTILNQICLNVVNNGFRSIIFSGELTPHRLKNWTHQQAAGRQYVKPTEYDNLFTVPSNVGAKIDTWLTDKFFIYNNRYGNKIDQLLIDIKQHVIEKDIDMVVLDNVMAIDFDALNGDKYDKQKNAILAICDLALELNIHIHLVAHPRKSVSFLRKEDISGTADLTNRVDNVFICHRINQDFNKAIIEHFGKGSESAYQHYSNAIEICKNRDLGVIDIIFPFTFEVESKRLLNEEHENVVYGWNEQPVQQLVNYSVPTNYYEPIKVNEDDFLMGGTETEIPF